MKMLKKMMLLALITSSAYSTIFGMFGDAAATSPDGKWLALGSDDSTIKLLNKVTKKVDLLFCKHEVSYEDYHYIDSIPKTMAFSPDGKYLAVGSYDKTIRIWNIQEERWFDGYRKFDAGVESVKFNEDGTQINALLYNGKVVSYDVPKPRKIEEIKISPELAEQWAAELREREAEEAESKNAGKMPEELIKALNESDDQKVAALIDSIGSLQEKITFIKTVSSYFLGRTALRFAVNAKKKNLVKTLLEYYQHLGIEVPQDLLPRIKNILSE